MPFYPAPKYRVLRLLDSGEWTPATYPDGEEVWNHGRVPEACARHAVALCLETAEREPGSTFIAVCPEGAELFRAEPITLAAPF